MNLREARNLLNRLGVRRRMLRKRLRSAERYLYTAQHTPGLGSQVIERMERGVAERRAELEPIEDAYRRLAAGIADVERQTGVTVPTDIVKLAKVTT